MNINYPATLIKIRAVLSLSQMEFANYLGISFSAVNRLENDKHEPTIKVKRKNEQLRKENEIEVD